MTQRKTAQRSKSQSFVEENDYERGFVDPQNVSDEERRIRVESHEHNGLDAPRIDVQNLVGLFQSTNAVPSDIPKTFYDQIKIYSNGGTRRLYIYVTDSAGSGAWRYAALT